MKRTILHVVESFGGGVANAVCAYARATPELEHHLLRRIRRGEYVPSDGDADLFASIDSLSPSNIGAIGDVRRRIKELRPDVLHAHSSYAGAISRVSVRATTSLTLCYTPHCYAFERQDLPKAVRATVALAERMLAHNTTIVAACSPREADLAQSLRKGQTSIYVPNVSRRRGSDEVQVQSNGNDRPRIVTMGRISSQKDPTFFANVTNRLADQLSHEFWWIGDGEETSVEMLDRNGVRVTGWLPQDKAIALLRPQDVYVHTAAWEAMPLVLLEAHSIGMPIVARRVPSMPWITNDQGAETPHGIAALVHKLLTNPLARVGNVAAWDKTFKDNSVDHQRRALSTCYGAGLAE